MRSLLFTVFLVFLVLKLAGVIAWSWWWVTAPLWMPLALLLGGMMFLAAGAIVVLICGGKALFSDGWYEQ